MSATGYKLFMLFCFKACSFGCTHKQSCFHRGVRVGLSSSETGVSVLALARASICLEVNSSFLNVEQVTIEAERTFLDGDRFGGLDERWLFYKVITRIRKLQRKIIWRTYFFKDVSSSFSFTHSTGRGLPLYDGRKTRRSARWNSTKRSMASATRWWGTTTCRICCRTRRQKDPWVCGAGDGWTT